MALSLAGVIILGLIFNRLFTKMKLPGLLGMLILGVIMGPFGLNLINKELMDISADLRKIALVVILLRAGLGVKRETLNKIGKSAFKLSFIPGVFEGITIMFIASYILGISKIEAGMLGFIIAAVSPAVVVPSMLGLMERKMGEQKGIPTMILAGASVDDVIMITIFSSFLGLYGGKNINIARQFFNIPVSIILGIALGIAAAVILLYFYNHYYIRNTKKALMLLSGAILLTALEDYLHNIVPIASLLGVMTIGFIILERKPAVAEGLASKFNKIWVFAEIMLFVLVGAQVNIYVAADSGLKGVFILAIGLAARSLGVYISLMGTNLNLKEKIFSMIAYIPKATVQAAIGAVPLMAGVPSGELILALSVLAIVVTAPLGAIGIKFAGERCLEPYVENKAG
jgi:solute carrier family 9B (sodium/hydrogen exchanger), member 1/2